MRQMRQYFLVLIFMIIIITPIGVGHADSTRIEEFSVISEVIPGENISVAITVNYDFSSNTEINPGIFSFEADDWIVDEIDPVSGSDTVVYTMEFPAPLEDGTHLYQANVWYKIDDTWFFDGVAATYNFTIQIGDINGTASQDYANIIDLSTPVSVDISSPVNVTMILDYSLVNETEYSLNIRDSNSEIISEEFLSISGSDQKKYNLTFTSSDTDGNYSYTINLEYEFENSSLVDSKLFSIEVNALVDPDPPKPDTPDDPDIPPVVTPPDVTPPVTEDPVEPDPEKSDNNMIYYGIALLIGAVAVYKYWTQKKLE